MLIRFFALFLLIFTFTTPPQTSAADWPMFRYDAGRTASSPHALPEKLHPQWTRNDTPRKTVWDDPLNQDLMKYDRVFEPIVLGQTLYIGFNDSDKLLALDTSTGAEKWRFYTDGPVRFPPVAQNNKIYFACDDGFLYCLNATTGKLNWKFRGGPSDQRLLGNERLISTWPARGAPVLRDGSVYFAASIWPFMGTFIYALDAETGTVQWINDGTGADYIDQPHNNPAFASVAPQGVLVATKDKLIIPGGRSIPAVLNRHTGKLEYFHLALYGKTGGAWAFANESVFFGHERDDMYSLFNLKTGKSIVHNVGKQPVLSNDGYYFAGDSIIMRPLNVLEKSQWTLPVDASGDLIRAGNRLYAATKNKITVVQLHSNNQPSQQPQIIQTLTVDGDVKRLIAANNRLFAVTLDGKILAFGSNPTNSPPTHKIIPQNKSLNPATLQQVAQTVATLPDTTGYALIYDAQDNDWLEAFARQTKFKIIAVTPNQNTVDTLRLRLDVAGLYGKRIAVHHGSADNFQTPYYMSTFTRATSTQSPQSIKRIYKSLRPFGGRAWLSPKANLKQQLANDPAYADAKQLSQTATSILSRPGALTGADDWTHQYGNIQNTIKSNDSLVKLPLGVLWFGGNSNLDVLPRHGHGPPEQIIGGRLFIQGMESLSARDVYTGRVMWKTQLAKLNTFGVFFDETYKNTPLSVEYNQVHIPGSNSRGTNFIATQDKVYIIEDETIRVLDTTNGRTVQNIALPNPTPANPQMKPKAWGYIGVADESLIAGVEFANYSINLDMPHEKKEDDTKSKWRFTDYDKSASATLLVMDRQTGKTRWRIDAKYGFLHNAITVMDGILYCLDKLPPNLESKLSRLGQYTPQTSVLAAYDLKTGAQLWQTTDHVFGTWLSTSQDHNILLQTTRPSLDTVASETGTRMIAYHAKTGKIIWDKAIKYSTPPILHNDNIITGGKKYSLLTGEIQYRTNPLTGEIAEWSYVSTKGCNYPIASENLITFRSSAAAFFDLSADGGTGHFGGFKSGCTSNLIAAGGVLNAPDYTRTCRCSYQNQTSLALVHMPDIEIWTHNNFKYDGKPVQQVGLNFGAPGDRRADNGTLWMDYPSVGGPSPNIQVQITGPADHYRHHASSITGEQPWVAASGIQGAQQIDINLTPKPTNESQFSIQISEASDDAEEKPNGTVTLTSSDIELVEDTTAQTVGLRFRNIPIAPKSIIKSATIQFQVDEPTSTPASLTIAAEATPNATKFTTATHNLSTRKQTTSSIVWIPATWAKKGAVGAPQQTPELAPLLQEIIDKPNWKSNNAVAFLIKGSGKRVAKSFNGSADAAPKLIVELEPTTPKQKLPTLPTKPYTIRLIFAEPNPSIQPGQRKFDVSLQGTTVLKDFDITATIQGQATSLIKEFHAIQIADTLTINLQALGSKQTIISGVEIIAE